MKKTILYTNIENSTSSQLSRITNAKYVQSNPEVFTELFSIALNPDDKNHHKACWVLELVVENNILLMTVHIDDFCNALKIFKNESALRSISKICMILAKQHNKAANSGYEYLATGQIQCISEACFDWLINDVKVATKACAMRALFEIGKLQGWIYPQLIGILEKDFALHTAAYQAASKELLRKIKKL